MPATPIDNNLRHDRRDENSFGGARTARTDMSMLHRWENSPPFAIGDHREADIFVEDDEWDYDWRLMTVNATDFGIDDRGVARHQVLPGATACDEHERYAAVQAWAERHGGIIEATNQLPILAIIEADNTLHLIDGWHRVILGGTTAVVGRAVPATELCADITLR